MTRYLLMCQNCDTKIYTDGSDISKLVEVKSAPVPSRANGNNKSFSEVPKKYKCPNCGHCFKLSKVGGPPSTEIKDKKREEPPPLSGDEYLNQWANDALKSVRNKRPPT